MGTPLSISSSQLRSAGGGYQGELDPNDPNLKQTTREGASEILPSGNEVIRSAQHLVMIVDPETGATQQAICDMKKTQLKVSRRSGIHRCGWSNTKVQVACSIHQCGALSGN